MPWYSEWSLGEVLIFLSQAIEPVGGYTTNLLPVPIYTAW